MSDLIDLTDKTVIVTGASSGIGAATARALHTAGAYPVLAARRADRLAGLTDELGGALAVPTDVTDPAQVRNLVAATLDRHGRVDGLVNDVSASVPSQIADIDLAEYRRIFDLNVASLIGVTQAVLPTMRRPGSGRIVNIIRAPLAGWRPAAGAYAATKSAVNMISAVLREELAVDGIAVSLLLPSITATEFGNGIFQLGVAPRPGMVTHHPEYVAGAVLRLLRTGEDTFDIPHGPEQPDIAQVPE